MCYFISSLSTQFIFLSFSSSFVWYFHFHSSHQSLITIFLYITKSTSIHGVLEGIGWWRCKIEISNTILLYSIIWVNSWNFNSINYFIHFQLYEHTIINIWRFNWEHCDDCIIWMMNMKYCFKLCINLTNDLKKSFWDKTNNFLFHSFFSFHLKWNTFLFPNLSNLF